MIPLPIPDECSVSARFDPAKIEKVAINHKRSNLEGLKPGRLAGIYVIPTARAVETPDTPPDCPESCKKFPQSQFHINTENRFFLRPGTCDTAISESESEP